jgi:predicted DNA-binding transcriptional regulator AlpA
VTQVQILDDELWDDPQLAKELGTSPNTPAAWRTRDQGPPYLKIGRLVRYRPSDVRAWLASRVVRPSAHMPDRRARVAR